LSSPKDYLINIYETRFGDKLDKRPIYAFITDNDANMTNINNKQTLVVRSKKHKNEKPKLELLDKFIYCSRDLNIPDEQSNSILVVLIFKVLVDLVKKHQDFNISVLPSFNYTYGSIVNRCYKSGNSTKESLEAAYKELKKLLDLEIATT